MREAATPADRLPGTRSMRLLVSVASAEEAVAALVGGADVIDAKNPSAGALGPVTLEVLGQIHGAVAGARPVTAALGDASDEAAIEQAARAFAAAGAMFVKVGFCGISSEARVTGLMTAAVRGAACGCHERNATRARRASSGEWPEERATDGVVAVAYADAGHAGSLPPGVLADLAARAGAKGVLLDTADKRAPGLLDLVTPRALAAWVDRAHTAGLLVALAGKLAEDDLDVIRGTGADIAGVRGAACEGGRKGRVVEQRVRMLQTTMALSLEP